LVHDPSVLLLDEPWAGLDATSSSLLERTLMTERDRGALIVVSSHAPEQAERLGARRIQLAAGRLATQATVRTVG
jgi:tungstate transport system ATP-binding protein